MVMRSRRGGLRGQSTIELALALVAAICALVAMWPLLRDAMAGRWKASADVFSFGLQWEEGWGRGTSTSTTN